MSDTPVRIRMLEDADGLSAGSEWDALRDGSGWLAVDKTQGAGAARNWRCIMPGEYELITQDTEEDYEPDGSPSPRTPASLRRWWPDAEAEDPPED